MPAVSVRNLSDEVHRALKLARPEHAGRDPAFPEAALSPEHRVKNGSELEALSSRFGGLDAWKTAR